MTDDFHYSGPAKDKDNRKREQIIFLQQSEKLKHEEIVEKFVVKTSNSKKGTGGFIELELNHKYERKTIISDVHDDNWLKTIKSFCGRAEEKGISKEHITLLGDVLDDNAAKIIDIFGTMKDEAATEEAMLGLTQKEQTITAALEFVEKQKDKLFLDQVNRPYIALRIKNHIETMPVESQTFEVWLGAAFYNHQKELERQRKEKEKK